MTTAVRPRGEDVRAFIMKHATDESLAAKVSEHFGITRQAANLHLRNLTNEGALIADGNTRSRTYKLAAVASISFRYEIAEKPEEDIVWRNDIRPFLGNLPQNVLDIWNYAFTEMFNNAVDHSAGEEILVTVTKTAIDIEMMIADDGIGIFRKIQKEFELLDERQAILELSKGKLTTDKKNHSGQGIFFTSRLVDSFDILSGGVFFSHEIGRETDWLTERNATEPGTAIFLKVHNHTARSYNQVMHKYSTPGSYGFTKTIVPVKLAKYGTDQLVSRSQAKRVLARVEQFAYVIFDFQGVDTVGQAFADQIFRVFPQDHPNVKLSFANANQEIRGIINAAIKSGRPGFKGEHPSE